MGSLESPPNRVHPAILKPPAEPRAPSIPELRPRFRLSTLLLAMTSSAVCLAVARRFPEVAIGLVFVMAIAIIRVLYGIQLHVDAGAKLSFRKEVLLYLLSLMCVIAICGFVVLAFSATLGAGVGIGLLIAQNTETRQTEWIFGGFISGWILGLIAALLTGGWLAKSLWFENLGPREARSG